MEIKAQALLKNPELIKWEEIQVRREWVKAWNGMPPHILMTGISDTEFLIGTTPNN